MEFKDYYKILGVARTAAADEIKKAFRKLAREYHPDVAKDKKSAEEKFKEINEAYDSRSARHFVASVGITKSRQQKGFSYR